MESEKFICVRETGAANSVVIVDMANPSQPMKRCALRLERHLTRFPARGSALSPRRERARRIADADDTARAAVMRVRERDAAPRVAAAASRAHAPAIRHSRFRAPAETPATFFGAEKFFGDSPVFSRRRSFALRF